MGRPVCATVRPIGIMSGNSSRKWAKVSGGADWFHAQESPRHGQEKNQSAAGFEARNPDTKGT